MIPSMRTKRRRVIAEVTKCLMQLTDDNLSDTCQPDLSSPTELCSNGHNLQDVSVSVDLSGSVLVIDNEHNTAGSSHDEMPTCDLSDICTDLSDAAVVMNSELSSSESFNDPFECSVDLDNFDDCSDWTCKPVCDDDEEFDLELDGNSCDNISEQLAAWAVGDNIPQASLTRLLHILSIKLPELPTDARTLLKTNRKVNTRTVAGGEYYYFGVKYWLQKLLGSNRSSTLISENLNLHVNIDGIPLFKSCNTSLWPILGMFAELGGTPFPIALFCSKSKPSSLSDYLHDFITEMNDLCVNGYTHVDLVETVYRVYLCAVICDAPARAFVKCIKPHSGYDSCERCVQIGVWCNKVTLPNLSAPLRTDKGFLSRQDLKHHTGKSPFVDIESFNMVSGFPLDYMHLVCLGVVRRLINLWINGPRNCKIGHMQITTVNDRFADLRGHIPREFARKPRSLYEYKQWKATELRLFLIYTGPICLKGILSAERYSHFMDFSVAMRLLLSPQLCYQYLDYAEQLLQYFVSCFGMLYGKDQMVYNVHSLIHLVDDARRYGVLDHISSFPFESCLGKLKSLVHRPQMPCAQIVCRLEEGCCQPFVSNNSCEVVLKKQHFDGPLPTSFASYLQYKQYVGKYFLSNNVGDNCCIIENKVGIITNILRSRQVGSSEVYVVFEEFESKESFFVEPMDSQSLCIFVVSKLSGFHKVISIADAVFTKCLLLPYKNKLVVVPQMHCC
jgi:hypothetical protein